MCLFVKCFRCFSPNPINKNIIIKTNLEEKEDVGVENANPIKNLEQYSQFNKIGYGATSKIYLTKKNNKTYICKSINKNSLRKGYKEIKVLQQLNSNYLSKLHEYIAFDNKNLFIFMEYEKSVDLHKFCFEPEKKYIPKSNLIDIIKQMGKAIKILHSYNFLHLDIKLENFIITDKKCIKLIDFGTVQKTCKGEKKISSIIGTKNYSPPELYRYRYHNNSDIWSYAICIWILIMKNFCFNHNKLPMKYTIENFPYEQFTFPTKRHENLLEKYPNQIKDMFQHVFKIFPIDRPDIEYLTNFDYNKYLIDNK